MEMVGQTTTDVSRWIPNARTKIWKYRCRSRVRVVEHDDKRHGPPWEEREQRRAEVAFVRVLTRLARARTHHERHRHRGQLDHCSRSALAPGRTLDCGGLARGSESASA